jgi:DNA-directed RNA polymerase specialized sigma24 family protein
VGTHVETDAVLLARVRNEGDPSAFACLYQRHHSSARRFARSLCGNEADADDITADVFASLFSSLRRGRGPSELALPYLFASIRNRHWRTAGRRAHESELARAVGVSSADCASAAIVEADVVRTALATLPDEVQALLWRSEVDDHVGSDTLGEDGPSAHTLAVHRHRARRALGTAYLAQHAEPDGGVLGLDPECRITLAHLAPLVRNKLGARRRRHAEAHLANCEQCAHTRERLERINAQLRAQPTLPWSIWSAGLTSAVKSQISGWLGTSAVTLAGSSALAMAVVVPIPLAFEPTSDPESQSAPGVDWPAPQVEVLTPAASTGSGLSSDELASAPGEVAPESLRLRIPPTAAPEVPTTSAPIATTDDRGSSTTPTTSADVPADASPLYRVAQRVTTEPLAVADMSATDPDQDGTDGEERDGGPTKGGKGQGSDIEGRGGTGGGQGPSDADDGHGPMSVERNGNSNAPGPPTDQGNAVGPGQSNGGGNANGADAGLSKGRDNGNGVGPGLHIGRGNSVGPGRSNGQGNGLAR